MIIYPDNRILVAVMNNPEDWARVQDEGWYRLPVKHAPAGAPDFDFLAFYHTKAFDRDKWAIHFYAPVKGHELLTRQDLLPGEPNHKRANDWYYKFQLGPLQHKLPPIISYNWRRITFIITTGDRFEAAEEINDLLEDQSPAGRLYVTLKEAGLRAERNLAVKEKGGSYVADLAVPLSGGQWLPVLLLTSPAQTQPNALYLSPNSLPADNLAAIQRELARLTASSE
jgi:hypothetical protein